MRTLSWITAILGVLFIVVGIGVSIALHEVGHLIPAKKFGVTVRQYMVGFGPTLWSRRRGETEYGIKAIPLGGYVRMIGMFPPRPGDAPDTLRASSTGRFSQLADQARAQSMEEIQPGEQDRVFYKLSTPRKVVTMLGGPLVNLAIGAALLTGYVTLYGVPDAERPIGAAVSSVTMCVIPDSAPLQRDQAVNCEGRPPAPAYAAGIRPGDRIVTVAGVPVTSPQDLAPLIRPNVGRTLPVEVIRSEGRDQRRITLSVTPTSATLYQLGDQGQVRRDAAGEPLTERGGFIGIGQREVYETVPQPLSSAAGYVWGQVSQTAALMARIPEKMVGVWQAAFGSEQRDPNGPVSVVGVGRVAGEKAGGQITGSIIDDIDVFPFLVQLLAALNIALFVFNLIPLLPMDGGHVVGALWEGLRRRAARAFGRPDPGPVDVARALPIAYAASIVLIGMSALLIYADIVKPIRF
ncbi:MAG TPA: site-2 protease family protein [Dermatophilaceae bacterium]|nr:site-2 protease family protein [Dermatophilaceae bacterium]